MNSFQNTYKKKSENFYLPKVDFRSIDTGNYNYTLKTFETFFLEHPQNHGKPGGYLDHHKENVLFASGHGVFLYFKMDNYKKENVIDEAIEVFSIPSNIEQFSDFYIDNAESIRDLLVLDDKLFVSLHFDNSKNDKNNNIGVLVADIDYNFLEFRKFYEPDFSSCTTNSDIDSFDRTRSGGRMVSYKDNKIIFTVGTYGIVSQAQNNNNCMYGKIISIDQNNLETEVISMGHRNPQGLFFNKYSNTLLSTEHGPKGGDEVNRIITDESSIPNYGWPISSYGEHYDGIEREYAPLKKSHSDFGFIEPLKYYVPSIAISQIINVDNSFIKNNNHNYFVTAMGNDPDEGDLSIHHIETNTDSDKIIFEEVIPIGDRIRDIIYVKEINAYLLSLETYPAIGILNKIDLDN